MFRSVLTPSWPQTITILRSVWPPWGRSNLFELHLIVCGHDFTANTDIIGFSYFVRVSQPPKFSQNLIVSIWVCMYDVYLRGLPHFCANILRIRFWVGLRRSKFSTSNVKRYTHIIFEVSNEYSGFYELIFLPKLVRLWFIFYLKGDLTESVLSLAFIMLVRIRIAILKKVILGSLD